VIFTHLGSCGGRIQAGHEAADELDPEVVVSEQVAEAARLHHVAGALARSVLTRERQTALGLAMALKRKPVNAPLLLLSAAFAPVRSHQ
jgi:hypothetical protein